MLIAAFVILGLAVLLGAVLAVMHIREGTAVPPWAAGALHALLGLGGLGCLLFALRGPARGAAQGTASFGAIAAALLVLATAFGLTLLGARIGRRRIAGALIGVHATLAVGGFVVLAAYVLAG
jgi:hypothetical protein